MFGGGGSAGGSAPAPNASGFYFGDTPKTPVREGVATGGGLPAGTVMPGGTVAGGVYPAAGTTPMSAGAGVPAGATAGAAPQQNTMSGQSGIGAGLADSFKAIGDMIANYQTAGAYGKEIVNAQAPTGTITPVLATFSVPQIARRV
jgi:hypothetical protein